MARTGDRGAAGTIGFVRENAPWLAAGFLMALGSSVGQTFFIALFSDSLRAEFGLSHGAFGAIYMIGTLASAATLIQLGRLADKKSARSLAVVVAVALGAACLAMALTPHWIILILVIFSLRLLGQGMLSHLSQTCMARWFNATRGRALAIAAFGYPTGEALAPLAAVALIAAIGWRETWGVAGAALALGIAPALWLLLRKDRTPRSAAEAAQDDAPGLGGRHWTRGEALRDPMFWSLFPTVIAPGFILTVVFFLPGHLAEVKGWTLGDLTARYWLYAAGSVAAATASGFIVDRFSARACLVGYQLPMAAGLVLLWAGSDLSSAAAAYLLFGISAGAAATVHTALWAELYGVRHLGSIKAMTHAAMVFSTAAGPGVAGAVIDQGVALPEQAIVMAAYVVAGTALNGWLMRGRIGEGAFRRAGSE